MGVLHWPPPAFWGATVYDALRALAGHRRANGHDREATEPGKPPPLSQEKTEELLAMVEAFEARERMKQRESDGNQSR